MALQLTVLIVAANTVGIIEGYRLIYTPWYYDLTEAAHKM